MDKIIVYTDGGARGNPGPAGAGAVICDENGIVIKKVHKALGVTTNNVAEYQAVILALDTLKRTIGKDNVREKKIEIRLDSELIARQLSGKYQIKEETLAPLFLKVWNMRVAVFPHISFVHISREKNTEADALSNLAMDESEGKKAPRLL